MQIKFALLFAGLSLAAGPALAQDRVYIEEGAPVMPPPGVAGPQAAMRAAARRANHEPGLAREVAPDARQTATGGPSGGLPGRP